MFCGVPSTGVQQLTKTGVFPSLEVGIPEAVSYLQAKGPDAAGQSFSQCTTTCKAESKWLSWVIREVVWKRWPLNRECPGGRRCCELSKPE